MPVWLWWALGGLATFYVTVRQQREAALQSIDVGLLMIKASSSQQAAAVTASNIIHSPAGDLKAESGASAAAIAAANTLTLTMSAPNWLAIAAQVQSAGYPLLANSIATLGMSLIETGQLQQLS